MISRKIVGSPVKESKTDRKRKDRFRIVDTKGEDIKTGQRGLLLYYGGTVCDYGSFDDNAADAICREMGYSGSDNWMTGLLDFFYIQQKLDINVGAIECDDDDWSSCSYSKRNKCGHMDDVFLSCSTGKII